jgi:two-component system, cell cycle sensor histidine kinase PleC
LIGRHRRDIYEQYYKHVTSPGVDNLDAHLNAVDRRQEFRDFQFEYLRPDGSKLYFKTSGRPHFGQNGEFKGYRGAAVDITRSKKAEFELERTTFQLLEAQRIAQIGSWTFDFTHSHFSWSEQVFRIFEVDLGRDDLLEKTFFDAVYPDGLSRVKRTDAKSLINQEAYETTHRLLLPGGRIKWVQARGETNFDKDGKPLISWGTVQDVTEIKRFEDDLTQALSVANQASSAKSDFLATMSHELRTPLNAIIGFSEILNQQLLGPIEEEKYLEYAQDIEHSGRYLLELIDDILDMSKIEAKEYRLTKSEINIRDAVEDCVKLIAQKASNAGINIFTEFSDTLPPLFADQRAIKQILLNLLSNSLDFTPENGEIKISVDFLKEAHLLTVSDTGSGIPTDEIPFILKPFKTAQLDPHKSRAGTGLGLAITSSLVELHGGELDINSNGGKGTAVTIKIPTN